jgi:hypothetical protein
LSCTHKLSPGFWPASETLGIIVEKQLIRKNYLSMRFNLGHYGLQSRPCPDGPEQMGQNRKIQALVAQMDRVLASEAKGRGFDSRRARHLMKKPASAGFFILLICIRPIIAPLAESLRQTRYQASFVKCGQWILILPGGIPCPVSFANLVHRI